MKKFLIITLVAMTFIGCNEEINKNPFFDKSYDTPFGVPPFDKIKLSHYVPAFEKAIELDNQSVELITSNRAEPTFENTILPLDNVGEMLQRVSNVFFNIRETDNNDSLSQIANTVSPMLSNHSDNILMNQKLFNRVKAIYDSRLSSNLDSAQIRIVEKYYNDFVRNGALLNDADQNKLRSINERISLLTLKFGNNLLSETNNSFTLVIDSVADLVGLPDGVVAEAAHRASEAGMKDKWIFTLQKASMIPFLQYSDRADLREKLYNAYCNRGNNNNEFDNKAVIIEITKLRSQKANLLGFKSHAECVIAENMAKTPEAVDSFMAEIWPTAIANAKEEVRAMQKFAASCKSYDKIRACDWWYWAEKLRKAKYDIDERTLSEYFKIDNVRDGMFDVANKLYGITFKRLEDMPVYNDACEVYEVTDVDKSHLGVIYFDWFPRTSKGAGAWCTTFRNAFDGQNARQTAVVSIACNLTAPTSDKPALLSFDDVQTMFHEFGHGLHFMFTKGKYHRTAGVVPNDYVELPSQVMEHWASEPLVMKSYAQHYLTGDTIPDSLIEKLRLSSTFNQGFATTEYMAAAMLDLKWHEISSDTEISDAEAFETNAMDNIGLISEIVPRYRSTYFSHIFDGGYSAGYYVYMWAEVLDADAFDAFASSGDIFNKQLADKFRKYCLEYPGEDDPMKQYVKFRGQEPSIEPLLINRGLE